MKRYLSISLILLGVSLVFASPKPGDFFTQGNPSSKRIALTFDDGPGPNTEAFLNLLDRAGVKATFFMQGTQVKLRPQVAREVKKRGHEIGQHLYSHINYAKSYKKLVSRLGERQKEKVVQQARQAVYDDMKKTEALLFKTVGERPRLCRMPHGIDRPWIKDAARDAGLVLVNWTYGADWTKTPTEELTRDYVNAVKPGAIILLHDGWPTSDASLSVAEAVIKAAQEKGLEIVPVGRLIGLQPSK